MDLHELMAYTLDGKLNPNNAALKLYRCGAPDNIVYGYGGGWAKPAESDQLVIENIGGLPCEEDLGTPGGWCDRCPWRNIIEVIIEIQEDDIPF